MSAPRYNLISAEGWHDDGPAGELHDLGGTAHAADIPGLLASAEDALLLNGWPGRVFLTDADGNMIPRRHAAALAGR